MFKTGLTNAFFNEFVSSYRPPKSRKKFTGPLPIFVDGKNIKCLADLYDSDIGTDGVFAVTVGDDGSLEMLAVHSEQQS